ncbi:MarR family transcriptional regulator [Mumia zhuanghuii]|uniref:MarR family winged helix-turn-helix transcriptional regulator n=2 Tax=Mumia TaxID=1546255 RepID=A0ABW1QHA8_9ACTN|nr:MULTISPECIES: MarR family transcriptional regulator [Mumia]KAA1422873.1 MarR family transcriptional regulator [Mumia zhuanghuii]
MPTDAQKLAAAIARLNRRLRQERHSDLTPNQISILGTLHHHGPLTPGAIAAIEQVQPPSVTRTVNCLVDNGLVERTTHPTDRRQVVVSISQEGREGLAVERDRRDTWLAGRLAALTTEERAVLRDAAALLEKLVVSE